ncbi:MULTISPECIES: LysR family transcriptional regulator [Colwellia]|uniref:LysR family transcriptional regulator n=1 Tax=Colwellia marinimaniae TaxID=1513592 RepID=A0ABQ0MTI3_9GAMM|nr:MULTISPECIES: LysR family transcriptional regulator [Colwellia]GAW95655.1 LysR family transcriptional regulator [Colwellia marinimaniae]
MNITLKQIRAFLSVAQVKSFAEACELLHISQPALSITIKNLEETVGGKLIARSTRVMSLTPEGELFLPVAKRLLSDFDSALVELHESFILKRGNLSFAAMPSFASTLLPKQLVDFNKQYPAVKVKVHDVIAEDAIAMVRSGKVEFAISFDPGNSDDLNFKTLFTDKFIVAFANNHPLSHSLTAPIKEGKAPQWQQLSQYPFIALQRPSSIRLLLDETLAKQEIFLDIAFEANQLATVVQMVANNLGISVIPSLYQQQLSVLKLNYCEIDEPAISRRVGIISKRRHVFSHAATQFLKVIQENHSPTSAK